MSDLRQALNRFIVGRRAPEISVEMNDDLELIFKAARKQADLEDRINSGEARHTITRAGLELQRQELNITWPEWADKLVAALGLTDGTRTHFGIETRDCGCTTPESMFCRHDRPDDGTPQT